MLHLILATALTLCLSALFLVIVREDNASGKIRNYRILAGLALVGISLLMLGLQTAAGRLSWSPAALAPGLPPLFFRDYLVHCLLTVLATVLLWKGGTWPAGDAKLFILAALAIPVITPAAAYFPTLLFLILLINIFLPAGLTFMVQAAARAQARFLRANRGNFSGALAQAARRTAGALNSAFEKPGWIASFLLLTVIFGSVGFIKAGYAWGRHLNEPLIFALLLMAWPALFPPSGTEREGSREGQPPAPRRASPLPALGRNRALGAAGLCALACLHPLGRHILSIAAYGAARSVPFMLMNKALKGLMDQETITPLDRDSLRQGTILTEDYFKAIRNAAPDFYAENFSAKYPDGLTAEQAEELKKIILRSGDADARLAAITAHTGNPFAGWIAFGALLTLVLHGETVITLWKFVCHSLNG